MNKKIWSSKGNEGLKAIDDFLSGNDIDLDKNLFIYDIKASIAHVNGLKDIKILNSSESRKIIKCLKDLNKKFTSNKFKLTNKYEDCHSAIEFYLTKELGETGKKIHTGRSRNDQIQVALRLYAKDNLTNVNKINKRIAKTFLQYAKKYHDLPMPGYTHLQRAMPSTWGLWFSSFAEAFIDNYDLNSSTIDWIDSNPLGTAAGYGVDIPLNRKMVTKELGFKRIQLNSLYVQNSRGKYEMQIINSLKQSMLDIRKFAWDMSLFLSQEFNLLTIGDIYLTGSSIMPNKKNPDVIEIMRGNYSIIAGNYSELENLLSLPTGYHRDLQITKKSLISSFKITEKTLELIPDLVRSIKINKKRSLEFIDDEMMMTSQVYELVSKGMPFRDAYQAVKDSKGKLQISKKNITNSSSGSPKNLNLEILEKRLNGK